MERKTRKKQSAGTLQKNVKKDTVKSGVRKPPPAPDPGIIISPPITGILDLPLNPDTARQAIILSEIIGKPVSKRGRRR